MGERTYLGDGVYAEVERGMIKLVTSNGIRDQAVIYLEPEVYQALVQFVDAKRTASLASGDREVPK